MSGRSPREVQSLRSYLPLSIGLCEAGRGSEVRHLGTVAGGCEAVNLAQRARLHAALCHCRS